MTQGNRATLKTCPTCATPVDDTVALGLRDFTWLGDALPGRVGASDVDCVIEQSSTGRILVFEFKPAGAPLPMGQRLLLKRLVQLGADVWIAWEHPTGEVEVGAMDSAGQVPFVQTLTKPELSARVASWWTSGQPRAA